MEWISVKNRLPGKDDNVLIASPDFANKSQPLTIHMGFLGQYGEQGKYYWVVNDFNDSWELDEVTHWMEIPKPPGEFEEYCLCFGCNCNCSHRIISTKKE